jgi:hypothetical protein
MIFVLATAIGATAQCDLTLKDAPAIRGLKFGMTGDQVIATIGKPMKTLDTDRNSWYFNPTMQQTDVKGLDGITLMSLTFYKDKLASITIDYNQQVAWKDAREFSQAISSNLNVPLAGWTYRTVGDRRAEMKCKEFDLLLDTSVFAILIATDRVAQQQKLADEKERGDEWKKAFKP